MFEQELNNAVRNIVPSGELRSRVLSAAVEAAVQHGDAAAAFDRRLSLLEGTRPDLINEGEYNPDYYKNMITRFTLCDPDDVDHLQGLVFSVSK